MIWLQFKTFSHLHRCYHCFAIPVSQTETSQLLSVTHSDVPGAFAVGFVQAGKTFTGHDAGVYDQVASTVEDWPEREREKEILPFTSCAVGFRKCCFCLCSYTEEHWGKNLHTHTFRCEKHSLSLFFKAGKVPSKLSWYVFFFIEVGQTKPGLLIHSICVIATLWLHRKKTVRVRFANTAAAAQSHTVWWHTHPLFRTRINTHQSSASFNF